MSTTRSASRDEVLSAFAVEADTGGESLKRYLTAYPEFAAELVDLSCELARSWLEDDEPLSPEEKASIEAGVERYRAHGTPVVGLVGASARDFVTAASALELPRQIMSAFREHRVDVRSVPNRFLKRLASALQTTTKQLHFFLDQPALAQTGRSNKSSLRPTLPEKVTFERLLTDAGVPAERIAEFLSEEE